MPNDYVNVDEIIVLGIFAFVGIGVLAFYFIHLLAGYFTPSPIVYSISQGVVGMMLGAIATGTLVERHLNS